MAPGTSDVAVAALDELARRLIAAEATRTAIEPVSEQRPGMSIDDAYAVQSAGRALRVLDGAHVAGHKIGLTSRPMQELVGVDQPDYGYLLDHAVHADCAHVPASAFIAPRVEGEIAFLLGRDLGGPDVGATDVLAATEAIAPALELIDSRIENWRLTIIDTIADNASGAAAIIGGWTAWRGLTLDLAAVSMNLVVDDQVLTGLGSAVLGHPAESVAWLVRALAAQGEHLRAGEIVLSGALTRALPIAPGSRALASFDALGDVQASF